MKKKMRGVTRSRSGLETWTSCIHYEAAIIKRGKFVSPAVSYAEERGMDYFICCGCGMQLSKKQVGQLQKIVDYLNEMGNDEKLLSKWYKGICVSESYAMKPFYRGYDNYATVDGIPMKNEYL